MEDRKEEAMLVSEDLLDMVCSVDSRNYLVRPNRLLLREWGKGGRE